MVASGWADPSVGESPLPPHPASKIELIARVDSARTTEVFVWDMSSWRWGGYGIYGLLEVYETRGDSDITVNFLKLK